MTVAELIEVLKELPQDLRVSLEGCDCYGPCNGAERIAESADFGGDYVLVTRGDDEDEDDEPVFNLDPTDTGK